MIYAAISVHLLLIFINYIFVRSISYPVLIFVSLWGVCLCLLLLLGDLFYELSSLSLVIFSLGALSISIGGVIGRIMLSKRVVNIDLLEQKSFIDFQKTLNFFLILICLTFPFYVKRLIDLSALSGFDDFWVGIRYQTSGSSDEEGGLGGFSYLGALFNFLAIVVCNEALNNRYKKRNAIFFIFLVFLYGLISTARIGVLTLIIALLSVFLINKKFTAKRALTAFFVFMAVFTIPAVVLGKGGSLESSFLENVSGILENLQIYFLAGIVAFSEVTKEFASAPETNGIFAFFISIARSMGFNVDSTSSILTYTSTPWPTNVYTIYLQYYFQFGLLGVLVIMCLLGVVLSIFHELAIRGKSEFIVLNAVATAFVAISVFSESFFTALSYWIQLSIFLVVFYRILPFINFRRF